MNNRRKEASAASAGAHSGRRPGKPATRDAILVAARQRFMDAGYADTTLRAIAEDAGVDPALINYFFGSKRDLFGAAMALPVNPAQALADLLAEGTEELGRRILERLLGVWDNPASGDPLLVLVRSAATEERAAELLREFVEQELVGPTSANLAGEDARLRAGAVASQLLGLIYARYVLRLEPLASAEPESIVATLAPALERLLNPPTQAPPESSGRR